MSGLNPGLFGRLVVCHLLRELEAFTGTHVEGHDHTPFRKPFLIVSQSERACTALWRGRFAHAQGGPGALQLRLYTRMLARVELPAPAQPKGKL